MLDLTTLGVENLPKGYVPIGVVMMVKCFDEDGEICWVSRYAQDLHTIECLGAAQAMVRDLGQQAQDHWDADD